MKVTTSDSYPKEVEFLDHTLNPRETQSGRRILAKLAEINSATSSALMCAQPFLVVLAQKIGLGSNGKEHMQC